LARQVLKHSDVTVPNEFGENFVVRFDRTGRVLSQFPLKVDIDDFAPTGFALLQNGEHFVVGYRREVGDTFVVENHGWHLTTVSLACFQGSIDVVTAVDETAG
jgi:hypothetical protein